MAPASMGPYARVAVSLPLLETFHYSIPEHLRPWVKPGVRVLAPFGKARIVGFVTALEGEAGAPRVKDIMEVLDPEPVLPLELVQLGHWLSAYYHSPPGETLASLLPPGCRIVCQPLYRAARPTEDLPADSPAGRLWALASRRGVLPAKSIRSEQAAALSELVRKGLVVREWGVAPAARRAAELWWELEAAAPDPDSLPPRSARLAQVLRALRAGPVEQAVLVSAGGSREALQRAAAKGWVRRRAERRQATDPGTGSFGGEDTGFTLTSEQARAVEAVTAGLESRSYCSFLLRGVTGSGKTEVYIRAVEEARRRGLGAVVLVPEISLTPQFVGRFQRHFAAGMAVLHSGLGEVERRLQWERVRSGEVRIAIGARSAVFAPVERLGLVVVDEEHEPSYKQEEGLRYNAKHVALQRARMAGAAALLGSATPDVETYWASLSGKCGRLELTSRACATSAPEIRIVDVRQEEKRRRSGVLLSEPLQRAVGDAVSRGEQSLLFLNRRGFSPALACRSCGEAVQCPRCSVSLTLHRGAGGSPNQLLCHYCALQKGVPQACPACGVPQLAPLGAGTQRLLEAAGQAWPGARILRLDRDSARGGGTGDILRSFHRGEADILIGTQMVTKGHHFPRLTVVGVVDADLSLHFPDFRAGERTFQVLTQVAGRAGRAELPGVVFLQTRSPGHPVLAAVAGGDYEAFARAELGARREAGFPPFRRLALLGVSAPSEVEARRFANALADQVRSLGERRKVEVFGPAPAPISRVRGRYRFQVLLKAPGPEPAPVQSVLRSLLVKKGAAPSGGVRLSIDVDPVSLL